MKQNIVPILPKQIIVNQIHQNKSTKTNVPYLIYQKETKSNMLLKSMEQNLPNQTY